MQQKHLVSTFAVLGVAFSAACSGDSTGVSGGASASLAFVATSAKTASASVVPTTVNGHTLDLGSVTLTISRAELKRTSSENCPGDDDEDDDHPRAAGSTESCGELKVGPTTIALPLDGKVVTIPANTIPAGTFRKFELRVSQVEAKGTFDGKAFDVTIPVRLKSEVEFSTPLVVAADAPVAITVSVPTGTWFLNGDGNIIDPAALAGSASLREQVANRIRASFRAFEDNDHDGHEDHDRHGHD